MPEWRVIQSESSSSSSSDSETGQSSTGKDMAPVKPPKSTTPKRELKTCYNCRVTAYDLVECTTCHRFCDEVCAWIGDSHFQNPKPVDKWQCPDCESGNPIASTTVNSPATPPRASSAMPFPATPTTTKGSSSATPRRAESVMPFSSTPTVTKGVEGMSLTTPKSKKEKKAAKEDGEKIKKRKNESKFESPIKRAATPAPLKPAVVVNKISSASKALPSRSLSPPPIPSRSMSPTPPPVKKGGPGSTTVVKKESDMMKIEPTHGGKSSSQLSANEEYKKNDDELKSAFATILARLPDLDNLRARNSDLQKEISALKDTVDSKENVIWELKEYNDNLQDKATDWEIKCNKLEAKLNKIRRLSTGANASERDEDHDEHDGGEDHDDDCDISLFNESF